MFRILGWSLVGYLFLKSLEEKTGVKIKVDYKDRPSELTLRFPCLPHSIGIDYGYTLYPSKRKHPGRWTNPPQKSLYRNHRGIDIGGDGPIFCAAKGVVYDIQNYKGDHKKQPHGNSVIVEHIVGSGDDEQYFYTVYSHLANIDVYPDQELEEGHILGQMGTTGNSMGVHLHFELRKDKPKWGYDTDPIPYLKRNLPQPLFRKHAILRNKP